MRAAAPTSVKPRRIVCLEGDGASIWGASSREVTMRSAPEDEKEAARRERTIRSLTDRASAPVEHVRGLFADEFARLGRGAKVRNFLHVLTTSNVRAMLRPASKPPR